MQSVIGRFCEKRYDMKKKHNPLCVLCFVVLGILAVPAAFFALLMFGTYTLMDKAITKAERQKG